MTRIDIPMVDLAAHYQKYRQEIDQSVARVLSSGWYILGKEAAEFERLFAEWLGLRFVVGVANGTDAITLALRSFDIGEGDAVYTVSHTAVATVAAIEQAGATPVLIDVDAASRTIDLNQLERAIRDDKKAHRAKPRAVVAVHLYGHACDLKGLKWLCEQEGLELIEDCAQAHGTTFEGRRVGSFGRAATFSFYPTKNLGAFGDAGAVAFDDARLAERCRALREYGWTSRYVSEFRGMNSRLDELHAALLVVKLRHLDSEIATRQRLARRYDEGMQGCLETPKVASGTTHAYHLYVVQSKQRDRLRDRLGEAGIGTGIHYPVPIHLQPAYAGRIAIPSGGLPTTELLAKEVLSLPMHPFLTDAESDRVIGAVKQFAASGQGSTG